MKSVTHHGRHSSACSSGHHSTTVGNARMYHIGKLKHATPTQPRTSYTSHWRLGHATKGAPTQKGAPS